MRDSQEKSTVSAAIAALFGLLLLLFGLYITGYFRLSNSMQLTQRVNGSVAFEGSVRCFRPSWLARIYVPAAIAEAVVTRNCVRAGYLDEEGMPTLVGD